MEQAVNQFNKGLQLDTNPMVLGNDTLSDALNATFVTMNGNEVVLQNDMGNRKIDNAFLPAGYEPVGMKEYGGIIYVAAYNPLTGRGLLGSFPSPERKHSVTKNGNLEIDFIKEFVEDENNRKILKTNSIINLLSINNNKPIILHAGDKFNIYEPNNESSSNYEQILYSLLKNKTLAKEKEGELKSLLTFRVGVLNSQNEFVDITDTLLDKNIVNNDGVDYKYFIGNSNDTYSYQSENDKELLEERLGFLNLNTYAYKTVSPLYLLTNINHIRSVNYEIYGEKNTSNELNLEIIANYYYNCEMDFTAYTPDISLRGMSGISISKSYNPLTTKVGSEGYENCKVVYGLNEINIENKETITLDIKHYIKDNILFGENNKIYIKSLDYSNNIDLSKLNSDTIEFNNWQYLNNITQKRTDLRINLTTYPKRETNLKNLFLAIKEYDLESWQQYIPILEGTIPSGLIESLFSWDTFSIELGKLYKCKLCYKTNINSGDYSEFGNELIFLSTALFNNNYNGTKPLRENAKDNNGKITYDYDKDKESYIENFADIKEVLVTPKSDLSFTVNLPLVRENKGTFEDISQDRDYTLCSLSETFKSEIILHNNITTDNKELYPTISYNTDEVTILKQTINNIEKLDSEIKINNNNLSEININLLTNYEENSEFSLQNDIIVYKGSIIENDRNNSNNKIINTEIEVNNLWSAKTSTKSITSTNYMTSFKNFLLKNSLLINTRGPYFAIDCENDHGFYIACVLSENLNPTNAESNSGRRISTGYYNQSKDEISSYITNNNNNLFVIERNENDKIWATGNDDINGFVLICGGFDSSNNGKKAYPSYRRIWFLYDLGKYIPIITEMGRRDNNHGYGSNTDFSTLINRISNSWIDKIPHYFVYNKESISKQINAIDFSDESFYNKSKEFNLKCNLYIQYKLPDSIEIDTNYGGFFNINKYDTSKLEEDIYIGNISSSKEFEDNYESMSINEFKCIGIDDNDNIILFDKNGDLLDSSYIYKLENNKLIKCYPVKRKFTIGEEILLPNFYDYFYLSDKGKSLFIKRTDDSNFSTESGFKEKTIAYVQKEEGAEEIKSNIGTSLFVFNKIPNIYEL